MLATLVIVFREALEAGLIVGIVLAATRGVPGRAAWVTGGILGGALAACVVAAFAGQLAELADGAGQEMFNAGVLLLAVAMLAWHNAWMAAHGRELARDARALGRAVAEGHRSLMALAVVIGTAVLREGFEVVLFLYGIAASGGTSTGTMLAGGALGLLAGGGASALMYFGLLAVPTHRLFAVTTGLITLLAAGLAAQAVAFLQQGGYLERLATPLWDSSWLLRDDSLIGRLMHTLVGYTANPNLGQVLAYALTVLAIAVLMRIAAARVPKAALA